MNVNQPLVSIGVPTYKRTLGVKKALDSLTNQTYKNIEIIVSNNNPDDDETDDLVSEYSKQDRRIKYYKQHVNIGPICNFQFVLDEAKGEYFFWAADDDYCDTNFVKKIVELLNAFPDVVLCACDVQAINENDELLDIHSLDAIRPWENWNRAKLLFFRYPTSNIFFCIYGVFRTTVLKECGIKISTGWKGMGTNGEVPFLAKVSTFGRIVAIPEVLKVYRSQPNSVYYNEIRDLSSFDAFMLRLVIRLKLIKLAIYSSDTLHQKYGFLRAISRSYLESISLRNLMVMVVPERFKKRFKLYAKKLSYLWR